jgi:hypothetical protein
MPRDTRTETTDAAARDARHGEKMIEIKVRFWTDSLAKSRGQVIPKHALTGGVVRIERNAAHGIAPQRPVPFNSLLDVGAAIEKCLVAHGVVLHPSRRMKRYLKEKL